MEAGPGIISLDYQTAPKSMEAETAEQIYSLDYCDDIIDGHFDFKEFGNTIFWPAEHTWNRGERDDIIKFEESKHTAEFNKGLRVSDKVSAEIKQQVKDIVVKFWDSFCKVEARKTIIGYEFAIDTGDSKPICCKQPNYGPYEAEIIMKQLKALLNND